MILFCRNLISGVKKHFFSRKSSFVNRKKSNFLREFNFANSRLICEICEIFFRRKFLPLRYNIYSFPCDVTWPYGQRNMLLGKWQPLFFSYQPTKFDGCRPCASTAIMFWICHVTQEGNIVLEVCPSISLTRTNFWKLYERRNDPF